jgi:hypothetical protein
MATLRMDKKRTVDTRKDCAMTDEQLTEFAKNYRCSHPGCVDWFDMTVERFVNVARAIEQASRRAALEESWEAVHAERLTDPTDSADDIAYNVAVQDCENAIRALAASDSDGGKS